MAAITEALGRRKGLARQRVVENAKGRREGEQMSRRVLVKTAEEGACAPKARSGKNKRKLLDLLDKHR